MKIERSRSGIWRVPLFCGWAIGIDFRWPAPMWHLSRRGDQRGWSFRVLWFHIGRAPRGTWTYHEPQLPQGKE